MTVGYRNACSVKNELRGRKNDTSKSVGDRPLRGIRRPGCDAKRAAGHQARGAPIVLAPDHPGTRRSYFLLVVVVVDDVDPGVAPEVPESLLAGGVVLGAVLLEPVPVPAVVVSVDEGVELDDDAGGMGGVVVVVVVLLVLDGGLTAVALSSFLLQPATPATKATARALAINVLDFMGTPFHGMG